MALSVANGWTWEKLRLFLPFDLDGLAVGTGALKRRRGVSGGEALARTLCLCALPNASFERAARQAVEMGLARMNSTALFNRFCKSEAFLRSLFEHSLTQVPLTAERWGDYRLLAVDATALCGPGASGTDQRLHVVYDLGSGCPLSVDLTSNKGGETLARHRSFGSGDLVLGDRGYGHSRGILHALQSGARVLVRFEFEFLCLLDLEGRKLTPERAKEETRNLAMAELPVRLAGCDSKLRAIGTPNLEGKMVWLLTDLNEDELGAGQARELYSKRWQIELFFKRLKSLLDLDELPTRDGPSARPWIWAKLLLATLATLTGHERFSPWGYPTLALEEDRYRHLDPPPSSAHSASPAPIQTRPTQRPQKKARPYPQTALVLEA